MRDEKEYKSKIMWKTTPLMSENIKGGLIELPTGVRASVVVGRNEDGMEHVSIELFARRLPTWNEMCFIKNIFWNEEEMVVQIHPKASEYVNITESLHLWRPIDGDFSRLNR